MELLHLSVKIFNFSLNLFFIGCRSDLMPIFEIIGMQDERMANFQSVLSKSKDMLSHGCPAKISVPLLLGVSASVALTEFKVNDDIDDSLFEVLNDYEGSL